MVTQYCHCRRVRCSLLGGLKPPLFSNFLVQTVVEGRTRFCALRINCPYSDRENLLGSLFRTHLSLKSTQQMFSHWQSQLFLKWKEDEKSFFLSLSLSLCLSCKEKMISFPQIAFQHSETKRGESGKAEKVHLPVFPV